MSNSPVIFFDVDTQIDFMLPAGALYVPGAEKLIPGLARLTEFARTHGIPIISSTDAHTPRDPEFRNWPPHCVAGTLGQHKVPETLLANTLVIPNEPGPLPEGWRQAPQVIVQKQTLDVFETCTIDRVLEGRLDRRFLVYGVVTEYCVLCAAKGLLHRGAKIEIVTDAIRELDPAGRQQALAELLQAGARLTTVDQAVRALE
jgi:nicotinamidase/pyrazinamidase